MPIMCGDQTCRSCWLMNGHVHDNRIATSFPCSNTLLPPPVTGAQGSTGAIPSAQPQPLRLVRAIDRLQVRLVKAVERIQAYVSECWLKLQGKLQALASAIRHIFALQVTRISETVRTCRLKFWTKIKNSLASRRQWYAPSAWLTIMLTPILGGVSLRYPYVFIKRRRWMVFKSCVKV